MHYKKKAKKKKQKKQKKKRWPCIHARIIVAREIGT